MKPNQLLITLVLTALALALRPAAHGSTISWSTDPDSLLFNVNGGLLDNSFTFELGTFGTFIPTAGNYGDWLTYWKRFDRATAANGGFNPLNGTVSSNATVLDGVDPADHTDNVSGSAFGDPTKTFAQNEQGYVFVYNSLTPNPGTEWGLYTSPTWLMPQSSSHTSVTLDWNINADGNAVLGGVRSNYAAGVRFTDPVVYDLQTSTAVPEPSSAMLVGCVGLLGLLRRRRK